MKPIQLKIKIKSLAAEAKIIKHEERRTRSQSRRGVLRHHRTHDVRSEARHSLLLYGFLRGRKYSEIERYTENPPDWGKVKSMGKRFAGGRSGALWDWCADGQDHIDATWGHQELAALTA